MRQAEWTDYELIDTGSGERLERWKDIILIRPDPQIIWKSDKKDPRWKNADARYKRSNTGGGQWQVYKKIPDAWKIDYKGLSFRVKTMGFKHTGVFPSRRSTGILPQRKSETAEELARTVRRYSIFSATQAVRPLLA